RHRESNILGADAARALADVNQPVLVAVDERPQQHAAHHAEDGGVGADAERQRERHCDYKPFGASQRAERRSQIMKEQFRVHSTSLQDDWYIPRRNEEREGKFEVDIFRFSSRPSFLRGLKIWTDVLT